MSDKHTPEPWSFDGFAYIFGNSVGSVRMEMSTHMVAEMRGWGHLKYLGEDRATAIQLANGERIVACVNALQGQDPARVKAKLDAIDKALPILKAHRDSIRDNPTMRDMSKASHVSFCVACQAYMILSEARALEDKL